MAPRNNELPEGTDHIITGAMETGGIGAGSTGGSGGGMGIGAGTGSTTGTGLTTGTGTGTDGGASTGFIGSEAGDDTGGAGGGTVAVRQQLRDGASSLKQQATGKVREFAEGGKERTTTALDDISQVVNEAADSIDAKLGEQYGRYARQAADTVSGFAETLRGKNVDELYDDVRGAVRASPVAAVGIAAAVGFALVRLVKSSVTDTDDTAGACKSDKSKRA